MIYQGPDGRQLMIWPAGARSQSHVQCDVQLTISMDGEDWDLIADLHSHHTMGAFWSATDDASERIRGVIFGVFSWHTEPGEWRFRRFTGERFQDLTMAEVVGDG